jgi:hypothetical protein
MKNQKKSVDTNSDNHKRHGYFQSSQIIELEKSAKQLVKLIRPATTSSSVDMESYGDSFGPVFQIPKVAQEQFLKDFPVDKLKELLSSSFEIQPNTLLSASAQKVEKTSRELSVTSHLAVSRQIDKITYTQNAQVDIFVDIEDIKKDQKKILDRLDNTPNLTQAIAIIQESGLDIVPSTIRHIRKTKSSIVINNSLDVVFEPDTLQCRLVHFFFTNSETLKKKAYELGDVLDILEPDYLSASKAQKAAMKKRYFDVRRKINEKFKAQTGLKVDFIVYENMKFGINQNLLNNK